MKKRMLLLLLLFVFFFGQVKNLPAQSDDKILAQGNPPLTQLMVGKVIVLLDWALELQLAAEQESQIGQALIRTWQKNDREDVQGVLEVIGIYEKIAQMGEKERNDARGKLKTILLQSLRENPNDELSQILISAYEAKNSANSISGKRTNNSSASAAKNKQRVGADGFSGIYRLIRPKALDINSSSYEPGYTIEYITFFPDGNVYWTLPAGGLLYFDAATAQRNRPNDWGTYEIKNGEIHVLRGPERKLYVLTRNGDRLNNPPSLGKGTFRPVPPSDGLRLDGSYRRGSADNPAITFTRDGKFSDQGAFRYSGYKKIDGTDYKDDGTGGSGEYSIEQNTLELRYSDGRVKRFSFIAFPENLAKKPAVDSFIINWNEIWNRY